MNQTLRNYCELFIENRTIIKSNFGWENSYLYPLCAGIYTGREMQADPVRMKECRDLLKQNTGVFSNFRGESKLALITQLAISPNPEEKLKHALEIYGLLKAEFYTSSYLPITALAIADLAQPDQYESIAGRTRHIYELMKQDHPFLTASEDSAFSALLALSQMGDSQILYELDCCYETLKPYFFSANAVQSLTHVLALGEGGHQEKCRRTVELFDGLKDRGHKYSTGNELPTLGVLALLDRDIEELIHDVIEADEYLEGQKGFGAFGIGSRQRRMYAAILTADSSLADSKKTVMNTAAINGTVSVIIAQEAAMCAAIAAAAAASAASSSSSSN